MPLIGRSSDLVPILIQRHVGGLGGVTVILERAQGRVFGGPLPWGDIP